jgi:hypothetical protein
MCVLPRHLYAAWGVVSDTARSKEDVWNHLLKCEETQDLDMRPRNVTVETRILITRSRLNRSGTKQEYHVVS